MSGSEALYCYAGLTLRVNLSSGEIKKEPTLNYAREWVGSTGIAIKILYDELQSWVTPYDPANKIVFGTGALMGTPAPGACKMSASTLGPRTGGWASGCCDSYVGGELKCAGYDTVVIEGRARTPVYLWIHDEAVEIRDASHLWGKTTWETLELIRADLNDPSLHTLSIGPAGENIVRGACIVQDRARAFGRCGTGAVMGSKNLKAIVAKGTGAIKVADRERFMEVVRKVREMYKTARGLDEFRQYGTLKLLEKKQAIAGVNYRNFQEVQFPEAMAEAIEPKKTIDRYMVARQNFPGCPIGCGRHLHITEGPYAGLVTEANQWEAVPTLQGRLGVEEPTFMFKANALCNQLGLDIDAAGGAIGWAMECYQRGILTEKDTGGLKLEWGDAGVALELIRKIAYREGFGDLLAEGCAKASDLLGREKRLLRHAHEGTGPLRDLPWKSCLVPGDDDFHARRRAHDGGDRNPAGGGRGEDAVDLRRGQPGQGPGIRGESQNDRLHGGGAPDEQLPGRLSLQYDLGEPRSDRPSAVGRDVLGRDGLADNGCGYEADGGEAAQPGEGLQPPLHELRPQGRYAHAERPRGTDTVGAVGRLENRRSEVQPDARRVL